MELKKIAIISTHPIQYNAPLFRLLTERKKLGIKVFYTWGQLAEDKKYDPGFGKNIAWDIPLLDGYEYTFVKNTAAKPGSHHFQGINNPSLIKEIEKWEPDAVLVFGWCFKTHLNALRYFKRKKIVLFRGDSNLLDEEKDFSLRKMARRIFLRWVYTHVDNALYVGKNNKNYYIKYGLKKEQLIFAPHAIDNDRFGFRTENSTRDSLGVPAGAVLFLFAGKFETKKNPGLLLKAFIQADIDGSHLLLVGNGVLEKELKSRVVLLQNDVQKRIHFMDFKNQSKMPELYSSCDVFVLPSQGPGETWGLSVNEAMACSRAVLVSDKCGCYPDLVQEGINGFVFTSNDRNELVNKMKKISADNSTLHQMGVASRKIINDWNYDNVCLAMENAIL